MSFCVKICLKNWFGGKISFVEISCFFNFFMWVVDVVLLIEDCWVDDLLFVFLDFEFIFFF